MTNILLEKEYQILKEKYKNEYRLVADSRTFYIQHNLNKRFKGVNDSWVIAHRIREQESKGFWSIFGLGDKEYSNEENYAKSEFIKYIDKVSREEIRRII